MAAEKVLIIDDEENMRHLLSVILKKEGYRIDQAQNGQEALVILEKTDYDFILTDIRMPQMNGFDFLDRLKKRQSDSLCIVMSAYGSVDTAIEAMKKGAFAPKPLKSSVWRRLFRKARSCIIFFGPLKKLRNTKQPF